MPPHSLTFVVEDGTGIPEANSFITYDFARQFWFDHGYGDFADTGEHVYPQQTAIVRGSRWISDSFDWEGRRKTLRGQTATRGQGLAWPRIWAIDDEGDRGYEGYGGRAFGGYGIWGDWVDSDSVPEEIQKATAEAAWYEVQNPHELAPTFIAADRVKVLRAGAASLTLVADDLNAFNTRPVLHKVLDLCEHLISDTSRSSMFGSSARG